MLPLLETMDKNKFDLKAVAFKDDTTGFRHWRDVSYWRFEMGTNLPVVWAGRIWVCMFAGVWLCGGLVRR